MLESGQVLREAWINGVREHSPGAHAAADVASWEELPEWERDAANAVSDQVREFVALGGTRKLTRVQKGQFVALCFLAQAHKHGSARAADWDELAPWQREVDADVFEHIERIAR
ncbi:hypothetical protein [Actinokineospora sp. NBRC 105648]|uniref:hypothetical protein n=1 Tax=Actinokineospora sp. NBRC 105648 TaxID=3032206 RepID=UPI002553ADFA|nr:hypothetical protein [Actinokineospora sp. NBRC 105648]